MKEKITKEIRDKLRAPLPAEAIKPHPTKTFLSTIKPIFVTERLSDVFGVDGWQVKTDLLYHTSSTKIKRDKTSGEEKEYTEFTVMTKVTLTIPEFGIVHESIAGSTNDDLGDAAKGATTDSLTKICSWLEIGIDVYKGKKDTSKPEKKSPNEKKPAGEKKNWLNPDTQLWKDVVARVKSGVKIDEVKAHFQITKENETKLIEESK